MKYFIHHAAARLTRFPVILLSGCFILTWLTGCESVNNTGTQFSPVAAKMEAVSGGGAQHFVLVNDSGQELHNVRFSAYMWDDNMIV